MNWRPRVIYDAGAGPVTLDFSLPQRPWVFMPSAIGGRRIAGSGVQAAYKVRHDELVEKRIRFTEDEWPDVRTWLLWAQGGDPFEWWDDQVDEYTADEFYLHEPAMGTAIVPQRSAEYPLVFELSITLRMVDSENAATRAYFPE